eukprot:11078107-Heterocapsa_arctica.AAC.1
MRCRRSSPRPPALRLTGRLRLQAPNDVAAISKVQAAGWGSDPLPTWPSAKPCKASPEHYGFQGKLRFQRSLRAAARGKSSAATSPGSPPWVSSPRRSLAGCRATSLRPLAGNSRRFRTTSPPSPRCRLLAGGQIRCQRH